MTDDSRRPGGLRSRSVRDARRRQRRRRRARISTRLRLPETCFVCIRYDQKTGIGTRLNARWEFNDYTFSRAPTAIRFVSRVFGLGRRIGVNVSRRVGQVPAVKFKKHNGKIYRKRIRIDMDVQTEIIIFVAMSTKIRIFELSTDWIWFSVDNQCFRDKLTNTLAYRYTNYQHFVSKYEGKKKRNQ